MFRHLGRCHLPPGSPRWRAFHSRGEESHSAQFGGLQADDRVKDEAGLGGIFQTDYGLPESKASKYREGCQGVSVEDAGWSAEEDHREIRKSCAEVSREQNVTDSRALHQSATYTAPLGHVPGVDDSGSGNEDGSGAAPPGPDGQRSRGSRATRRASPRMANGHPQSQPPPSPSVLSSPNPNVASQSLPPSPHIVQSPQQRGPHRFKAHYATARPGYEGYSGLGLAPSTYGSPQQAEGRSRINYSSGPAPHHEVYQNEETPASGAMGPPPSTLSHSRSWSEGPRRATSSGTYSMSGQYAFGNEYYAQDLAGVATTSGWAQGAHPTGNYDGPPIGTMLRRSSSLEGLRAAHNEYSQNASYER